MSEAKVEVKNDKKSYGIDVFRVTQYGKTSTIFDVKLFVDKIYSIETSPNSGKYEDKDVVVLTNPHNDEIYFETDAESLVQFISHGHCYEIESSHIDSAVIFDAIYETQFSRFHPERREIAKEF